MTIGYDNLDINHNIILDLPFREGAGTIAQDVSKSRYPFTLTGAPAYAQLASGIGVLNFTPIDFLEAAIADVPNLDFTIEDFSIVSWVDPDTLVGDLTLLCHGLASATGYYIDCLANGSVAFYSNQGGAQQSVISATGAVVINTPRLIGISRSEGLVQIFINGEETVYVTQDDITHPLTSAEKVLFGVYQDETTNPWSQYLGRQRAWLNRSLTADNHRFIWRTEKDWYGV